MRVGYLPVYVAYDVSVNAYALEHGMYATLHPVHRNDGTLKIWSVPYPIGLTAEWANLEKGLRQAGNDEDTVRLLCNKDARTPESWLQWYKRREQCEHSHEETQLHIDPTH